MEVLAAEIVVPCRELDATLVLFERLGFRVESITPADDPIVVTIVGHGVRLRLDRRATGAPGVLRLRCDDPGGEIIAPNGMRIELVAAEPAMAVPALVPSYSVSRGGTWHAGRAGMRYRDLIPDRQGGRFIASHIQIAEAGPVPDYVHFHAIRFQLIYCHKGWVRVVYEDQGPPFVMEPGDAVLQPPGIRHRVLEASAGLEVIEVTCPASHDTFADAALELPNGVRDREYTGQRFVRHVAADGDDLGITAATGGLASARIVRSGGAPSAHGGELLLMVVLDGEVTIARAGGTDRLGAGDAVVVPPGMSHGLIDPIGGLRILRVEVTR